MASIDPITLKDPILVDGVTLGKIQAPCRPVVGMLRRWMKIGDLTDRSVQMVVDLCGISPHQVDALSLEDWDTVQERVAAVIPEPAKSDPTSAA